MSHLRTQIRKQIVSELSVLAPVTVESVESTRMYSLREDQLPAINVYVASEESEITTMGGKQIGAVAKRLMLRTLNFPVIVYLSAAADVDDAMDGIAVEIEKILGNSLLNDLVQAVELTSTVPTIDAEGEVPIGVLTMNWTVLYQTVEGEPELNV